MNAGVEAQAVEVALRQSVDAIKAALSSAGRLRGPGDLPSSPEIHELLRLFAELPSEELRQGVLTLLRAISSPPCAR